MMTKEEVASIVKYCNDNGKSYKARLSELGVPEWRFFESKRHYAKEQASSASPSGEFLQLTAGGDFVPIPAFAAKTGRGFSKKNAQAPKTRSVELRTPNGTIRRIHGELDKGYLQSTIIQGTTLRSSSSRTLKTNSRKTEKS